MAENFGLKIGLKGEKEIKSVPAEINNSFKVNNIFKEGELDEKTSVGSSDKSTGGRKSKIYNLDVVIFVGYRVKSIKGVIFRKWANKILKEYLLKGYIINEGRTLVTNENYVRLINKIESLDERGTRKLINKCAAQFHQALITMMKRWKRSLQDMQISLLVRLIVKKSELIEDKKNSNSLDQLLEIHL